MSAGAPAAGAGPGGAAPGGLRERRRILGDWLAERGREHEISLQASQLHAAVCASLARHARESCLDAGAGRSPYRPLLEARGVRVVSLDWAPRGAPLDVVGDVQDMTAVASGSFATVLCSQVLEHVPRPWAAVAELARVLRPGGVLVLSVPHLSAIHEAPHDYFRYTRFGLRALVEAAGLELLELCETGGLVGFLAHPVSAGLLSLAARRRLLRRAAFGLNRLLLVRALGPLDRLLGCASVLPSNYVLAARKPAGPDARG